LTRLRARYGYHDKNRDREEVKGSELLAAQQLNKTGIKG
jgi:hypothetical protein